jgi:hypothetical protein
MLLLLLTAELALLLMAEPALLLIAERINLLATVLTSNRAARPNKKPSVSLGRISPILTITDAFKKFRRVKQVRLE